MSKPKITPEEVLKCIENDTHEQIADYLADWLNYFERVDDIVSNIKDYNEE